MEYWDIYDSSRRRTGRRMKRNDWILKDGEYHLSVLGGIVRPGDGRFLITRRKMDKAWAPGWWEISGGAVQAGEESWEAVLREIREETGLDVSDCPGRLVLTYHRENPGQGDNYFVDVYLFEKEFSEKDIHIQLSETTDFRIASPEEIRQIADQGIFLHYDSIKKIFLTPPEELIADGKEGE